MKNMMELNLEEMDLVRGGLSDVFYMRKFVKEDSAEYLKYIKYSRCPQCKHQTLVHNLCVRCRIEWIVQK